MPSGHQPFVLLLLLQSEHSAELVNHDRSNRSRPASLLFHEISISMNLRSRVKQIQPLAGRDTSRRFLFRCPEFLVNSALRLPAELPVICHALMANHAGFLCRTCDRRNKSIGQVVGAPRNHFEPAFVSTVEHERSVMTLVSPRHDTRFTGFNQEADHSARSLVDDHGCWDSSILHQAGACQFVSGVRLERRFRTWQPELKRDLIRKPGSNCFWRLRMDSRA
jgi:hypothetical protein